MKNKKCVKCDEELETKELHKDYCLLCAFYPVCVYCGEDNYDTPRLCCGELHTMPFGDFYDTYGK